MNVWHECIGAKLKSDLVVALACGAMGDGIGFFQTRNVDQMLGDKRPCNRGSKKVLALIDRVGPKHWEDEVADKLFAQVFNMDFLNAEFLGFFPSRFKLLALADISRKGNDLTVVLILQPFQNDRGIEPSRVGQNDLLNAFFSHKTYELPFEVVERLD